VDKTAWLFIQMLGSGPNAQFKMPTYFCMKTSSRPCLDGFIMVFQSLSLAQLSVFLVSTCLSTESIRRYIWSWAKRNQPWPLLALNVSETRRLGTVV